MKSNKLCKFCECTPFDPEILDAEFQVLVRLPLTPRIERLLEQNERQFNFIYGSYNHGLTQRWDGPESL